MKKLLFGICLVLMAAACHTGNKEDDTKSKAKSSKLEKATTVRQQTPCTKYTLDGTCFDKAEKMVTSFINSSTGRVYDHNHHTCVWYSKDTLEQMKNILSDPLYDGVRFYFAENAITGHYTAIAVSTEQGAVFNKVPSRHYHTDLFQTSPLIISSSTTTVFAKPDDTTPERGAWLYSKKVPSRNFQVCYGGRSNHYIRYKLAYKLVYKHCGSGSGNGKINSTSEWFDKGIFSQLVDLIHPGGGLRLYYAKHNLRLFHNRSLFSKGRHCFVLIITEPDATGTYQEDRFVCIPKLNPANKYLRRGPDFGDEPGDGGTDNGEECPTNCVGAHWIDTLQLSRFKTSKIKK